MGETEKNGKNKELGMWMDIGPPKNSPTIFFSNEEMEKDGGRVWEVGMEMGGPISIPIP